jgi:hypothetical protein
MTGRFLDVLFPRLAFLGVWSGLHAFSSGLVRSGSAELFCARLSNITVPSWDRVKGSQWVPVLPFWQEKNHEKKICKVRLSINRTTSQPPRPVQSLQRPIWDLKHNDLNKRVTINEFCECYHLSTGCSVTSSTASFASRASSASGSPSLAM